MNQTAIVPGSLAALAKQDNTSIAESFLNADVVVIVDVSGSMNTPDARDNKRRYDVACQELARLQRELPGKIAVVAFSDHAEFAPGGVPPYIGAGTNLAGALQFVKVADGLVKFIVISDGQPDNEQKTLAVARQFQSKIHTIYACGQRRCVNPAHVAQPKTHACRAYWECQKCAKSEKPIDRLRWLAKRCGFELVPVGKNRWHVVLDMS